MIYLTRTITSDRTPLMVGDLDIYGGVDGTILVCTPDKQVLRVPRFLIETPVLCCKRCSRPVLLLRGKHSRKEYAECPDHAQHMYQDFYAAANDGSKHNRKQRHEFTSKAKYWLNQWKRVHEKRTSNTNESAVR